MPGEVDGAALNFHDELSTVIEKMVSLLLKYIPHILYTADQIHFQESVAEIIVDSEGGLGKS